MPRFCDLRAQTACKCKKRNSNIHFLFHFGEHENEVDPKLGPVQPASHPKLGPVQPASQCPASGCALSISSLTFESESKVNRNPPKKPMAKFLLRANPPPISFIVDESVLANVKGLDHEVLRKAFSGECDTSRCLKEFKDALLAIGGPESASLLAVPPNSCSTPLLQSVQSVRGKQIRIFSFKACGTVKLKLNSSYLQLT